jgi:diacylglycerol kinase (ATP)
VPMGTANLMGRHLGIAWDAHQMPQQVVEAVRRRRIVELDAATTRDGIFLLMAGVGFDAHVVHELNRVRSGPISLATYVLPMLRAVFQYDFPKITVGVDGNVIFNDAPAIAMVGNVAEYGTGFPMLPHACSTDGLLDVCIMPCSSRRDLLRLALAAAAGEHLREEGVVYIKGRHVRVDSPVPVAVQVDGEAAGTTPVEMDLLPWKIPFIVP